MKDERAKRIDDTRQCHPELVEGSPRLECVYVNTCALAHHTFHFSVCLRGGDSSLSVRNDIQARERLKSLRNLGSL